LSGLQEKIKGKLGFDWENESEWEAYEEEVKNFYNALHRYIKTAEYLKGFNGKSLYDSVKINEKLKEVFLGGIEKEIGLWRYIRFYYGVGVDRRRFIGEIKKKSIKQPEKRMKEIYEKTGISYDILHERFKKPLDDIYYDLSNAILKKEGKLEEENTDFSNLSGMDYIKIIEDLANHIGKLSPLVNPKTFFLLSIHNTPRSYVKMMYGDTDFIESYFGWGKITKWKNVSENLQIWAVEKNEFWKRVAKAFYKLYVSAYEYYDEHESFYNLWSKYLANLYGYNIVEKYKDEYRKLLKKEYENDRVWWDYIVEELSRRVDIENNNYELVYIKKDIAEFYKYRTLYDGWRINIEPEPFLMYVAPQLFFNIAFIGETMSTNKSKIWELLFYIPEVE